MSDVEDSSFLSSSDGPAERTKKRATPEGGKSFVVFLDSHRNNVSQMKENHKDLSAELHAAVDDYTQVIPLPTDDVVKRGAEQVGLSEQDYFAVWLSFWTVAQLKATIEQNPPTWMRQVRSPSKAFLISVLVNERFKYPNEDDAGADTLTKRGVGENEPPPGTTPTDAVSTPVEDRFRVQGRALRRLKKRMEYQAEELDYVKNRQNQQNQQGLQPSMKDALDTIVLKRNVMLQLAEILPPLEVMMVQLPNCAKWMQQSRDGLNNLARFETLRETGARYVAQHNYAVASGSNEDIRLADEALDAFKLEAGYLKMNIEQGSRAENTVRMASAVPEQLKLANEILMEQLKVKKTIRKETEAVDAEFGGRKRFNGKKFKKGPKGNPKGKGNDDKATGDKCGICKRAGHVTNDCFGKVGGINHKEGWKPKKSFF